MGSHAGVFFVFNSPDSILLNFNSPNFTVHRVRVGVRVTVSFIFTIRLLRLDCSLTGAPIAQLD